MDNNTPQRAKMKRYLFLLAAAFNTACCYGQQYSIFCGGQMAAKNIIRRSMAEC